VDVFWLAAFSDWLINLSAGWLASAFVIPAIGKRPTKVNFWILTVNVLLAIVTLFLAVSIKRFLRIL